MQPVGGQPGQSGGQYGTYGDSKAVAKIDLTEKMRTLNDDAQFKRWYNHLKMIAKATGTNDVLNPNYTAGTSKREQDTWEQKQSIMYVALTENVKIPIGETTLEKYMDYVGCSEGTCGVGRSLQRSRINRDDREGG